MSSLLGGNRLQASHLNTRKDQFVHDGPEPGLVWTVLDRAHCNILTLNLHHGQVAAL
jgi:hypothetical protein